MENSTNVINQDVNSKNYIWIDSEINNLNNTKTFDLIFDNNSNIKCKKFETIEEAINHIKHNEEINKYKNIHVIVSGSLYIEFYYKISEELNNFTFWPTIIVYLKKKVLFIQKLILNGLYYNNDLLDKNLIFDAPDKLMDYILYGIKEEKQFSFELIDNYGKLAIPLYYSQLFLEDVSASDIFSFNKYLFYKYENDNDKDTKELVSQLVNKNMYKKIVYKYWLRLYTCNGQFYGDLNGDLRKSNINICTYFPFIKACYEGIRKQFFFSDTNNVLYRGAGMSNEEFYKIDNLYNQKIVSGNKIKLIINSKTFLSFSEKISKATDFLKKVSNGLIKTLFKIESIDNKIIDIGTISNVNLLDYSRYPTESEILFFPFSCFEIIEIDDDKGIKVIKLKYLAKYKELINNELNNIESIDNTDFSNYLINIGIIKKEYVRPIWEEKYKIDIKLSNICFLLDNNNDLVGYKDKIIYIFSIKGKTKLTFEAHNYEISCIIKLKENQICSSSKDKTIKIIKLCNNNTEFEIVKKIDLKDSYAKKLLNLCDNRILILNENNIIDIYDLNKETKSNFLFEFCNISNFMELPNRYFIYVKVQNNKKYLRIKEIKNYKEFEINSKLIENQNMIYYNNHIIIASNSKIDIYSINDNYELKYFYEIEMIITNIISISSNRFILGLYNSKETESIIREYIIKEDNQIIKFELVGVGKFKNITIDKIIKINESNLIVRTTDGSLCFIEKISKFKELLKANNLLKNEEKEIEIENNINNIIEIKEENKINEENKFEINTNSKEENNIINKNDKDNIEVNKNNVNLEPKIKEKEVQLEIGKQIVLFINDEKKSILKEERQTEIKYNYQEIKNILNVERQTEINLKVEKNKENQQVYDYNQNNENKIIINERDAKKEQNNIKNDGIINKKIELEKNNKEENKKDNIINLENKYDNDENKIIEKKVNKINNEDIIENKEVNKPENQANNMTNQDSENSSKDKYKISKAKTVKLQIDLNSINKKIEKYNQDIKQLNKEKENIEKVKNNLYLTESFINVKGKQDYYLELLRNKTKEINELKDKISDLEVSIIKSKISNSEDNEEKYYENYGANENKKKILYQ